MKKILLLFVALVFLSNMGLKAQDAEDIDFTLIMEAVLDITVLDDADHTITINSADLWNNGAFEGNGIVDGVNQITVDATANWNIQISAPDFDDGAGNAVPINNLGIWCEATGSNGFGGANVCACTSVATSQGLSNVDADLITNGTGNAGDGTANAFTLHWRFGTGDGSMNGTSLLNQLIAGDFILGTYTTTATLTATFD